MEVREEDYRFAGVCFVVHAHPQGPDARAGVENKPPPVGEADLYTGRVTFSSGPWKARGSGWSPAFPGRWRCRPPSGLSMSDSFISNISSCPHPRHPGADDAAGLFV